MLHREGMAKWECDDFSEGYSITTVQRAARPFKHIICMQLHWGWEGGRAGGRVGGWGWDLILHLYLSEQAA